MLGHYKAERGEAGLSAKPVSLRDHNTYSVILGRFFNEGFAQHVTLAQVFWWKDLDGPPARMFVVSSQPLAIAEHFSSFGPDVNELRKRLRKLSHVELYDSFPPYGTSFRRSFGIENEQALDLFHQTVSMKSVGNLTDFVRQHMLEPFAVDKRIEGLIHHFDDLNRAHEAVLKARAQVARLSPLVEDCDRYTQLRTQIEGMRDAREALRPWFAEQKRDLLLRRLDNLSAERDRLEARLRGLGDQQQSKKAERDGLKRAIADNGGDRVERLEREIETKEAERDRRQRRGEQYDALSRAAELPSATSLELFSDNRRAIGAALEVTAGKQATLQNEHTEVKVRFRDAKAQHDEIEAELASLRQRRSNIPARMLALRSGLCRALELDEDELPFAGELIQVREDERDWEGAIERALHGFALSLLIADEHYAGVAQWVERTHLGDRLVYYRVREVSPKERVATGPRSLVDKLALKADSAFYGWLDHEVAHRFDYACCDTFEALRRETRAITRAGQMKAKGERHEKDDRHRIDDRSRFVLGWSNEAKIATLQQHATALELQMQALGARIGGLDGELRGLAERLATLQKLVVFEDFGELDWRSPATEIERLQRERRALVEASDVLRTLEAQLAALETSLDAIERQIGEGNRDEGGLAAREAHSATQLAECETLLAATPAHVKTARFPLLETMRGDALSDHVLTVESCDNREKQMRDWLQTRIDAEDKKLARLRDGIIEAMKGYASDYPLETREVDVNVESTGEYRAMLDRLRADDLPRFEQRFKELLNENTIREVAGFQSQLNRERQTIRERIDVINRSLRQIDYNPGRYILLEAAQGTDPDVRDFQQSLRACTEGTLTGSDDDGYSEAKFLEVRRIIERFRGREGTTELDRQWTRKVTDVRNWYTFSASERWREDEREHEHYADSGGKSGGQKEKLAYTVLAASLAYQFGLEWGAARSRSFRFVVIDEAFGRGSDESTTYGLELFRRLNLQLLVVTPLQKIHIIEPYVAAVGFVHNEQGRQSMLRNLTIEEYRAERAARAAP